MAMQSDELMRMVLDVINAIPDMPCEAVQDTMQETAPCLVLRIRAGARKSETDILGGYTLTVPFSIYYRITADGKLSHMEAMKVLDTIGRTFDEKTFNQTFPIGQMGKRSIRIDMQTAPLCIARNENTTEDYQADYTLEYKQEG